MAIDWRIGDKIKNRWEICKILTGGMGVVYIVYDHEFKRPYAVKTFKDEIFAQDPSIASMFRQESLTWINIDPHQNVTEAELVEVIGNKPYLFLEYVSGGDLSGWIGTSRLLDDTEQALYFSLQFCDGMTHALSKGIKVHRDIKPQNCLVTQNNVLKITDFGLAKIFDDTIVQRDSIGSLSTSPDFNDAVSRTGSAAGTPPYMAPEQFDDAKHIDVRSDVYAFGVMLFEMLEGRLPFIARSYDEIARLHHEVLPPTLERANATLREIVSTCLAKHPAKRFQDFGQIRDLLAIEFERHSGRVAPEPITGRALDAIRLVGRGESLHQLGRSVDALRLLDEAIRIDSQNALAWSNKGAVVGAMQRPQEALVCYDRAIALDSKLAPAWSGKGTALGALGRIQEELDCYERAIAINPRTMEAWFNKGVTLRSQGRTVEAVECYERALEANPHDADIWNNKGFALNVLGRTEEAIRCFDRAAEINPNLPMPWTNKAYVSYRLGRNQEALEFVEIALTRDPQYAPAWANKGMILEGLKRWDEALSCFYEAQRLGLPEASQAIRNCEKQIEANLARSRNFESEQTGRKNMKGPEDGSTGRSRWWKKLFASHTTSPRKQVNTAEEWYEKALACYSAGEKEKSLCLLDRALECNPALAAAWSTKGAILGGLGRRDEGLVALEKAAKLGDLDALQNIRTTAGIFMIASQFTDAIRYFEAAKRSGDPSAQEGINLCRQFLSGKSG